MKRKATESDKPEKKLRWDVPKTASLINFYKDHPELWNPRVPEYSNDKLRLKAVETWLVENQLEPEKDLIGEVKLKLHGLRTSYGHELKMEATKKIDGQPYISKWQWYRQLSFLKEAMCFRSRSGSISSCSANGGRLRRRRGKRGLAMMSVNDDIDNNHSDSYYTTDHEGNDVKIVAIDHSDNGGPGHTYSMLEAEYVHHHHPPHAHASSHSGAHHDHPPHHPQHTGLVHMAVHLDDAHHHQMSSNPSDPIQNQDPHVPVVTYRPRDPVVASTSSSTITRNESPSNMNLMCLAAASTPERHNHTQLNEEPRTTVPAHCSCKCRSAPQTVGEKLGRLVEETFSNLHPEYHDLARWEIQQTLGKFLQKPLP